MKFFRLTPLGKIITLLLICSALSRLLSNEKNINNGASGSGEPPPNTQNELIITITDSDKSISNDIIGQDNFR